MLRSEKARTSEAVSRVPSPYGRSPSGPATAGRSGRAGGFGADGGGRRAGAGYGDPAARLGDAGLGAAAGHTGKAISQGRRWRELPVTAIGEMDRSLRVAGMPGGIGGGLLGCVGTEADSDGLVVAALFSVDDVG